MPSLLQLDLFLLAWACPTLTLMCEEGGVTPSLLTFSDDIQPTLAMGLIPGGDLPVSCNHILAPHQVELLLSM